MEELLIMYGQSFHVFTLQTLGYGLYMPFVFFWLSFFFFLSPTMNTNICILILKHFVALHFDTHAERPVLGCCTCCTSLRNILSNCFIF